MKNRFTKLSWAALWVFISSAIVVLTFIAVLYNYPWLIVSSQFDGAEGGTFHTPWPVSPREEDKMAKKNLRRYALTEQRRRVNIQLNRMKFVNSPLIDVFMDPNLQIFSHDREGRSRDGIFQWPQLLTFRSLQTEGEKRNLSYVVIPTAHGTDLMEAVILGGGDEMRLTVPLVKTSRNLSFAAFPLTPGAMKVVLGQYTWNRNFSEADVHKLQTFHVPINDATASNMRILSVSGQVYLGRVLVNQRDASARIPIQVAMESNLWKPNPLYFEQKKSDVEEADDKGEAGEDIEAPPITSEAQDLQPTSTTAPAENTSRIVVDANEEKANKQVTSFQNRTLAVGYNILLLQLGSIPEKYLKNPRLLRLLAPNLYNFLQSAVVVPGVELTKESSDLFRQSIMSEAFGVVSDDDMELYKYKIEERRDDNNYFKLRNYGYYVLSLASPDQLLLSKEVAFGRVMPNLAGSWLRPGDKIFADKNKELEEQADPVTGLEAVFNTKHLNLFPAVDDKRLKNIGDFITEVAKGQASFPDWGANEIFLPDPREMYFPRVVDKFQNWISDNTQTRFFVHAYLDQNKVISDRSIKDFVKLLKTRKLKTLTSPIENDEIAKLSLLDRAVGQILETLYYRKAEHRTIVGMVIPDEKGRHGNFAMKVPGLIASKQAPVKKLNIDDVTATLFTTVGIPLTDGEGNLVTAGEPLENRTGKPAVDLVPSSTDTYRYQLVFKPGKNGCSPFEWKADTLVFGVHASEPIYEVDDKSTSIKFFPCAIKSSYIRVTWYQKVNKQQNPLTTSAEIVSVLGGHIGAPVDLATSNEAPIFAFGGQLFTLKDVPLSLSQMPAASLEKLFDGSYMGKGEAVNKQLELLREFLKPEDKSLVLFWRNKETGHTPSREAAL